MSSPRHQLLTACALSVAVALVACSGDRKPAPPKGEPAQKAPTGPVMKQVELAPEVAAAVAVDAAPPAPEPPPDLSALDLSPPECVAACVRDHQTHAVSAAVIRKDCRATCEQSCVQACLERAQARAQDPATLEQGCRDSCRIPD